MMQGTIGCQGTIDYQGTIGCRGTIDSRSSKSSYFLMNLIRIMISCCHKWNTKCYMTRNKTTYRVFIVGTTVTRDMLKTGSDYATTFTIREMAQFLLWGGLPISDSMYHDCDDFLQTQKELNTKIVIDYDSWCDVRMWIHMLACTLYEAWQFDNCFKTG